MPNYSKFERIFYQKVEYLIPTTLVVQPFAPNPLLPYHKPPKKSLVFKVNKHNYKIRHPPKFWI